jgi:hypothetical protein
VYTNIGKYAPSPLPGVEEKKGNVEMLKEKRKWKDKGEKKNRKVSKGKNAKG